MDTPSEVIQRFVSSVRRRLNRHRLLDCLLWGLAVVGGVLLIAGLAYILQGERVPRGLYLAAGVVLLAAVPGVWLIRRFSADRAAAFADDFFGLKDTLLSAKHFHEEKREGDFYRLQEGAAGEKVADLSVSSIPYRWPRKLGTAALVVVLLSALMAFKEPSPEVLERLEEERITAEKTAEINEFLEEELEELAKDLEETALPEVDPEEIRKLPSGLKETKNQNEALRQYANLERQLREKAQKLDRRKEEALLAAVGEELQKDEENRELGRKLKEKEFQAAAEELNKMAPEPVQKEKLSEQRKELARLRAASQRMADAAKSANRRGTAGSSGGAGQGQSASGGMESELSSLSESVEQFSSSLKNAERLSQLGRLDADQLSLCESDRDSVLSQMKRLSESLCKMNALCESEKKLLSMCEKLGQCQGFLCGKDGKSLSQCLGINPGGLQAGNGSVESRTAFSDSGNTGELTQLQGIKGAGPSESMVEEATEGEGVATRRSVSREHNYTRQVESFVQREDVPAEVKEGVKRYFEGIHQAENQ
ncbi:MAG: hypothetical protein AAF733_06975 [Verrucomicrobiota bacterium]